MGLTKYKVVGREKDKDGFEHPAKQLYADRVFDLNSLTDEDATELVKRNNPYIEEIKKEIKA